MKLILPIALLALTATAGDFLLYPTSKPVHGSGPLPCGGSSYVGYVNYVKTISQGWGWAPDTNVMSHTLTDTNHSDTIVQMAGKSGDSYCGLTTAGTTNALSAKYRFTVFFTNSADIPSTTNYPILLHGFNP